jgi:phosphoglycolate phosphatase-like HAD superfamily hydrolase
VIQAVIFDLDGLLLDSEQLWDEAREELARERGGRWHDRAQQDMMGMSSPEWSRYMHEQIGLPEPPEEINTEVVRRMEELYRRRLPLIDGAVEAVERLAARWPLGLASSSNRELIDLVLELSGLGRFFARPSPPRRSRAESPRPTSTSRRQGVSASLPRTARRSRTPTPASAPQRRPECGWSSSRIRTSRRTRTRSRSPMSSCARLRS